MKPGKVLALLPVLAGCCGLFWLRHAPPLARLAASSLGMIWLVKLAALLWQRADGFRFHSRLGAALFVFAWPGISARGFARRGEVPPEAGARFLESWLGFLSGAALLIVCALTGRGRSMPLNSLSLLAVLLIVHLGLVEVAADGIRLCGFSPQSLFDRPWLASSLRDFWSVRWNRAFVEMNKLFILAPLRKRVRPALLTFAIFAVSGLLHELCISYSDGSSWGRPLLYFLIQGAGLQLEKRRRLPRAMVWLWILTPLPLLFTPAFTNLFLGGAGQLIAELASHLGRAELLRRGLILGGAMHLLVLCASVQVPGKLGWREDLQKLRPLNRKVFWTYGGYIATIIVFMALTSFLLSGQRSPSLPAFLWLLFIALFWWARVLTDLLYLKHADWPRGPLFAIGHVCLATLFISMSALYSLLACAAVV